jgi:hypothetical protein
MRGCGRWACKHLLRLILIAFVDGWFYITIPVPLGNRWLLVLFQLLSRLLAFECCWDFGRLERERERERVIDDVSSFGEIYASN